MTNNAAQQAVAPGEQGLFDAAWSLISSGFAAFATWASAHWGDIGLGIIAIALTMASTSFFRMWLDIGAKRWGIDDEVHKATVRSLSLVMAGSWAMVLDFRKHFGAAIGMTLDFWGALAMGVFLNSTAAFAIFHAWKWAWGPTESAKRFRAILRIKSARFARVSEEEIDAAATEKQSPAQMAELREAIKENESE